MEKLTKDEFLRILANSNNLAELIELQKYSLEFDDYNEVLGEVIEKSHSYDQETFNQSLIQLEKNFCKERLERSIEIKKFLIEIGAEGFIQQNDVDNTKKNQLYSEMSNEKNIGFNETYFQNELSTQEIPSSLIEALSEKDLNSLKVSLLNLLLDNSKVFSKLLDLIDLVNSKCPEIFKEYIEDEMNDPIDLDSDNWTVLYFHEQNLALETNFAIKRYKHLVDVREFLRKNGESAFQFITETKKSGQSGQSGQSKSIFDELLDILLDSLSKLKDVGCSLIEKVKAKFK